MNTMGQMTLSLMQATKKNEGVNELLGFKSSSKFWYILACARYTMRSMKDLYSCSNYVVMFCEPSSGLLVLQTVNKLLIEWARLGTTAEFCHQDLIYFGEFTMITNGQGYHTISVSILLELLFIHSLLLKC